MTGIALGVAFLSGFALGPSGFVIWVGLGTLLLARQGVSASVVALLLAGVLFGMWAGSPARVLDVTAPSTGSFEGTARVTDGPFLTQSGQRFLIVAGRYEHSTICAYVGPSPRPLPGDRVFATGTLTAFDDLSDIGRAAARSRGCNAQLRTESFRILETGGGLSHWTARARVALSDYLLRSSPGDVGALMSGLVTGDDGALSTGANQAFLSSGTTHITAISGANFSTLLVLLGVFASGSMRRNIVFVLLGSGVIWLFALMVGFEPSALRAALLATAVLVARWIGRRPDLLTLTLLLAGAQVLWRPRDFDTLGFQLSLAATLALIMVFDGSERNERHAPLAVLGLAVVAAQLATIPILVWKIGTVTGIGLLANLVVGPIASIAFPIALIGAIVGQILPAVGQIILLPAMAFCRLMIVLVEWCDRTLPGTVQLGQNTPVAILTITFVCWFTIAAMGSDLRRMTRHGLGIVRLW